MLEDNLIYATNHKIKSSDVDMYKRLKLSTLFRMFQEISIAHTEELGFGRDKTLDRGLLWVITRTNVEIERLPLYDEDIVIKSHPGEMMKVIFPRFYTIEDKNNNVIVKGSSLWILMDENTRKIVSPKNRGIDIPGTKRQDDIALPITLDLDIKYKSGVRKVHFSDIDLNGHVNNTKYLDWSSDLMSEDFHKNNIPESIKINYLSEVKPRTDVDVFSNFEKDILSIKGKFEEKEIFDILINYKKDE